MIGEAIGYVIFLGTMGYAKFGLKPDMATKFNEKFNAGAMAKSLWTLNLATNCILIFVETIAASYPLMEKACAACPKIYEFDEAIPKFGTLPTTEPKEVACADWVSQQVIFASELPKETWFNIIRLFLGLICVAMSIVSIFQADSPYKFGTSILLGHATEFTKKKDKGNNGDGGYWFGVAFCIMLFCGAGFYAGPIPMQYHLDQTIVWGMATGLVVSGGGMGWMVKLQKKSAGNVEVTPDDATTHKMLFSDYVIAITFLMGILGPLFGYATKGPNSAEWIGTNMTCASSSIKSWNSSHDNLPLCSLSIRSNMAACPKLLISSLLSYPHFREFSANNPRNRPMSNSLLSSQCVSKICLISSFLTRNSSTITLFLSSCAAALRCSLRCPPWSETRFWYSL